VVSFAVIAVLFALMFKYVPAAKISWRDVLIGAVGTALLFTIGKQLLGLYLAKASVGSTYGAAGSFVAVIVWIYYSAQIFFFGAEFTRVYGEVHGAQSESAAKQPAVRVPSEPETKPAQVVPTAAAPVTMAASVGSASPVRLRAPAVTADVSAQVRTALPGPITFSAEAVPLHERPSSAVTATPSAPAVPRMKPRLLMAAALGFILGRVFGAIGETKSSRS
jgi:hypothetical protein